MVKKEVKESNFTIGVIDDHIQTVISICSSLQFYGFKCTQAYNYEDAVEMVKKDNPDLLLVDIVMPEGKSGYDLAKAFPNKKVILMTAFEYDGSKIKNLKNVVGFLQKPIGSSEVLHLARKILNIPE